MSSKKIYYWWILAFALKIIGASWDASYHFKYLRDLTQLPHIVNALGLFLVCALSVYEWRKRDPKERGCLKVTVAGIIVFFAGIPLDQIWHVLYGIDLTTWSPSHFILYIGTVIMILGVMLQAKKDSERGLISGQTKNLIQIALALFMFEGFWFPLLQQEQGVIAFHLFQTGNFHASPELMSLVHSPKAQIFGGAPDWLYAVYVSLTCGFLFRLIKAFNTGKFAVTAVAAAYVLFRVVMNSIFIFADYPTSAVPYFLLLSAILFDIFYNERKNPSANWLNISVTCFLIVAGAYSMYFVDQALWVHPAIILSSIVWAWAVAVIGYVLAKRSIKLISKL